MSAVADLPDRQLIRRLGDALRAQAKVQAQARPAKAKLAAADEAVTALQTELGTRLVEGRWSAWDALGVDTAAKTRRTDRQGTVYYVKRRDRWFAELTVDGRTSRKVYRTQAEAEQWLAEAVERAREGRDVRDSKWTVASWLEHCASEVWPREGLSAATLRNHQRGIDRWWTPEVGSKRLATLQPEDVDRVIGKMLAADLSPNSVRIATAPLVKALRRAVERGHVTRNVASLATKPKLTVRRKPKYLTPDEARTLLAACPEARFGDGIALMMLLGLRRGELLGLCWDRIDLDGDRPTVTIDRQLTDAKVGPVEGTKTAEKGSRTVVLPKAAVAVLRRRRERQRFEKQAAEDGWRNPWGVVFTTAVGTPIDTRNFGRAVENLSEQTLGRKVNPHAMRHTAATLLHDAGVSMKVAQAILGHTTSQITDQVYTHVLDEQHDRAAAALDALLADTG